MADLSIEALPGSKGAARSPHERTSSLAQSRSSARRPPRLATFSHRQTVPQPQEANHAGRSVRVRPGPSHAARPPPLQPLAGPDPPSPAPPERSVKVQARAPVQARTARRSVVVCADSRPAAGFAAAALAAAVLVNAPMAHADLVSQRARRRVIA